MAIVPNQPYPTVASNGTPTPYQSSSAATPDAFGAQIGQSLSKFGDELGANAVKMQERANAAHANDLFANGVIELGKLEAQQGSLQGKARYDAFSDFQDKSLAIWQKYRQGLNPDTQKQFDSLFHNRVALGIAHEASGAAGAFKQYENQSANGALTIATQDAGRAQDEANLSTSLDTVNKIIDGQAQSENWAPEMKEVQRRKATDVAMMNFITPMTLSNPQRAQAMLEKYKDQFSDQKNYDAIKSKVDSGMLRAGTRQDADEIYNQEKNAKPRSDIQDDTQKFGVGYSWGKMADVKGLIIHHTGGGTTADDTIQTLKERNLGAQYVIDREGTVHQLLPDGAVGRQIQNGSGKGEGLNNHNTVGVEVIAKDDKDVLPAQVEAAKQLSQQLGQKYGFDPAKATYGHGEVNPGHKEADEGLTIANSIRQGGSQQAQVNDDTSVPAAIRYNNPGAMYPRKEAMQFGMVASRTIGGGNQIAVFPDAVSGAAANMSHLASGYEGMTIGDAQKKWSGGARNSLQGWDSNAVITKEMMNNPDFMVPFMKSIADAEAPRGSKALSEDQWNDAYQKYAQSAQGTTGNDQKSDYLPSSVLDRSLSRVNDYAAKRYPDDPGMQAMYRDELISRLKTQYATDKSVLTAQRMERKAVVFNELIVPPGKQAPTTLEQLSPTAQSTYQDMDPIQQRSVNKQLEANGKAGWLTPEQSVTTYNRIMGLATTDPSQFMDIAPGEFGLSTGLQQRVMAKQESIRNHLNNTTKVNSALHTVAPMLNDAGVFASKQDTATNDRYNQFVGAFDQKLSEFESEKKKFPTEEEQKQIASGLLADTTNNWFFANSKAFEVPSDFKSNVTPDFTKTFGRPPTAREMFRLYQKSQGK